MHEIQAEERGLLIEKNEHQPGNTTKASLNFVKKPTRTVQNLVVILSKKSRQVLARGAYIPKTLASLKSTHDGSNRTQ